MKLLWDLFITFAKVGSITFGGGYVMLPILQREIVEKKGWSTEEEILDYYAVGQCTPGIIAVNTATFVGYKTRGVLGGISATMGLIFPSLVIIMLLAGALAHVVDLELVQKAFMGIRICVSALIINAVLKLWKASVKDGVGGLLFGVTLLVMLLTPSSPVYLVASGLAVGLLVKGKKVGGNP